MRSSGGSCGEKVNSVAILCGSLLEVCSESRSSREQTSLPDYALGVGGAIPGLKAVLVRWLMV
jgi:hypothetical protein